MKKITALLALALLVLSGCNTEKITVLKEVEYREVPTIEEPGEVTEPEIPEEEPVAQETAICTKELIPVCAEADGERQTFDNECLAAAAGATDIVEGECVADEVVEPETIEEEEPVISCDENWNPVCGKSGGSSETYSNNCFAQAAGATDIVEGECVSDETAEDTEESTEEAVVCTLEYAPVCGVADDEAPQTFGNRCTAEAAGATDIVEGECQIESAENAEITEADLEQDLLIFCEHQILLSKSTAYSEAEQTELDEAATAEFLVEKQMSRAELDLIYQKLLKADQISVSKCFE